MTETLAPDEIYLASRDPDDGTLLRSGRFKLAAGTRVTATLRGLNPPTIAIGEQGRDTAPNVSRQTVEDTSGGIGVLAARPGETDNRVWWAAADLRYRSQITLLKKKTDRSAPAGVGSRQPRAGGVFNDTVYAAWDEQVYSYSEAGGWSALLRTLTSNATPTHAPLEWEGGWFWFLGADGMDVWNGTSWWNVAKSAVAGVVYASTLYIVSADGQVSTVDRSVAAAKITAGTLAAADFTDRVRVSDACSDLLLFTTADAEADVVPYVVGRQTLYQVDPSTFVAAPTGPQMPPHRSSIRAAVLGADNKLYIAQGMGVVRWDGQLAQPIGLDRDDGVPVEQRGAIVSLLNGGFSLFALIDATSASGSATAEIFGTTPPDETAMSSLSGYSWLASREESGWVVRAVSDAAGIGATCQFLSTAEGTYRLWFAWNGQLFSIDLEQGFFNPLDDSTGEYEATGEVIYSRLDFGYKENEKIGLKVEMRTARCSAAERVLPYVQFDRSGTWYELYNADGTHGIVTNGRQTFTLHADLTPMAGVYNDEPAVGKAHDDLQVRLLLERGATATVTPVVEFLSVYVDKVLQTTTGWTLTLDLTQPVDNRTPYQQRTLLEQLIADQASGRLHFSYLPDPDGAAGAADTRAVKVEHFGAVDLPGQAYAYTGHMRLRLAEAITDA